MKKLITKNKFFLYLIIILSIAVNYNFFLNTYTLIKNDYSKRLISIYGICEKEGYGFAKLISDKYDLKYNTNIINGEPILYPSIAGLFYDKNKILSKDYNENYISLSMEKKLSRTIISTLPSVDTADLSFSQYIQDYGINMQMKILNPKTPFIVENKTNTISDFA